MILQGTDGSASNPALIQDTGGQLTLSAIWSRNHQFWSKTTPTDYMVEETYHLSQYLGPFGAYFMPQGPK